MFYSPKKTQALSQHAILGLMYVLMKSPSNLIWTATTLFSPSTSNQDEPAIPEVKVEAQDTQTVTDKSSEFFAIAAPTFKAAAQSLPLYAAPALGMPGSSSSFGFFEAAETPLQQSGLSSYQWTMICLTVAVASIALTSLYHDYNNKKSGQSGGCTATATATATASAGSEGPVTATATATCHC